MTVTSANYLRSLNSIKVIQCLPMAVRLKYLDPHLDQNKTTPKPQNSMCCILHSIYTPLLLLEFKIHFQIKFFMFKASSSLYLEWNSSQPYLAGPILSCRSVSVSPCSIFSWTTWYIIDKSPFHPITIMSADFHSLQSSFTISCQTLNYEAIFKNLNTIC